MTARKSKNKFNITNSINKRIIQYCYEILNTINKQYLSDNEIYENEFLEYVYMGCKKLYETTGGFELTKEDIVFLIYSKRQSDSIAGEIKNGTIKLIGINKNDDLILEFRDKKALDNFNNLQTVVVK